MYTQLIFFLIEILIIFGCVKWVSPYWLNKTNKTVAVTTFLNVVAVFSGLLILVSTLGYSLIQKESFVPVGIISFAIVGSFLYTLFYDKKRILFITTTLLCLLGTFLVPNTFSNNLTEFAVQCGSALLWVAFIYMMQQFDRIFLFSFTVFSVFFLIVSLMCSGVFPFLSTQFQFMCFSILIVLTALTFWFKKQGIFSQGSAGIFFLSYIVGYFGYYLASQGMGSILPIFVAYELLEISLALIGNLYLYHKLSPIQVPFLIEKAYMTQKDTAKAVKKVFSISFFFSVLALLSAYTIQKNIVVMGIKNVYVMYLFTAVLLFQTYLVFNSWGQPKPEFKNLFKDLKTELKKAKDELSKKSLKKK